MTSSSSSSAQTLSNSDPPLFFQESSLNSLSNEALVLIHAFPLNHNFWNFQLETLGKDSGYRVIALDLPGFGESKPLSLQENEKPSISHYAQSIFALLDHLKIQKAIFVGCSMGGYILFEIWRQQPQRVKVKNKTVILRFNFLFPFLKRD